MLYSIEMGKMISDIYASDVLLVRYLWEINIITTVHYISYKHDNIKLKNNIICVHYQNYVHYHIIYKIDKILAY